MRKIVILAAALLLGVASAYSQSSELRYRKELVFPLYMGNLSLGLSPTIAREFMIHIHDDFRSSVTLPPVHLLYEQSVWDFGNAGSIGWGGMLSFGRYKYAYLWDNGYGGKEINVRVNQMNMLVGLSYHYTLATRLEAYTRVMLGVNLSGYKNDGEGLNSDWDAQFIWHGLAGIRYFCSDSIGVYVEGGYTTGYVNAGLTLRW